MPIESQLLFFHMILRADDDGVVESYPLMKLLNVTPDSFRVLLAKGYIYELNEDQVILVSNWSEHNTIRADRKVDSIYKPLIKAKFPDLVLLEPKPRSDVRDNSRRVDSPRTAEVKLSKVNIGEAELRIVPEEEKPTREKADTSYRKVFELWGESYPISWRKDTNQIEAAKNILAEHTIEQAKMAVDYYQKQGKDDEFCPHILRPTDLDRKWANLRNYIKNKHE